MKLTDSIPDVDKDAIVGCQWRVRARGEDVRGFILDSIEKHPKDIASLTAIHFNITRQAAHKHLQKLVAEKALNAEGKTRHRVYRLAALSEWRKVYQITPGLAEDQAWKNDISLALGNLPQNIIDIWHFCFTEIFNNAVDHSAGSALYVKVAKTAANTQILVDDDGIGIFKKIQSEMHLLDERHALFELSKGKLTTDPKHHTGQGIFFTSRLLDSFHIISGGVTFSHTFGEDEDWIFEDPRTTSGTAVFMKLSNHSARTCKTIFDQYSSGDNYAFTKTVVPVRLAQYGQDKLISRSQAKRLLARVDLFTSVIFDFDGVEAIGQAFADEIFRIFARDHPEIEVTPINANAEVQQMLHGARAQWASEVGGV